MENKFRLLYLFLAIMIIVIIGATVFSRAVVYFYNYSSNTLHVGVTMVSPEFELVYIIVGMLVVTGVLLVLIKYRLLKVLSLINIIFTFFLTYAFFSIAIMDMGAMAGVNILTNSYAATVITLMVYALPVLTTLYYVRYSGRSGRNLINIILFVAVGGFIAVYLNTEMLLILLVFISLYDYISVFITKHMIMLAKGAADMIMFSSISLMAKKRKLDSRRMMLGGGDLIFPAMFASRLSMSYPFPASLVVTAAAVVGLALIFVLGKKGKAYPAMAVIGPMQMAAFGLYILATLL